MKSKKISKGIKKFVLLSALIIIALISINVFVLDANPNIGKNTKNIVSIKKDNISIEVEVEIADNQYERTRGLMFRETLCENCGMLFKFEDDQIRTFWMKNTQIPLDIIFISRYLEIINISENTVPNQTEITYSSNSESRYVLEVNSGFTRNYNISAGDKVYFLFDN